MDNPFLIENNIEEQNYFSKEHLLKNFLSISVIYISLISIASYFLYSPAVSFSLFVFSILLFILRMLYVKEKLSYDAASLSIISLFLFFLVPICAYFTGGLSSPIIWWNLLVPIISLLLFGRCAKTATLVLLTVISVLIFAILNFVNYKFPAFDNSRINVSIFIFLLGLLSMAYTITWIFETQKSLANEKLIKEKERLKVSEASFRDIFENTDELIQNISLVGGKFLMVNPTWLQTLDYEAADVDNLVFENIVHPDSKNYYYSLLLRLHNEKNIELIKLTFITKIGRKVFVEGEMGLMMIEDKPVSIRGIFRDISSKKIAEDNELKSRLALEQAQELAQIGSWEINLINNIPTWSKEMYRIFGIENYHTGAALDVVFKQKLSDKNNNIVKNLIENIFKNDIVESAEIKIKNENAEIKYINIIGEPLKSANSKKIIGVKGTAQDVSQQKLAVLAKSNFLSTMSHEIRTPINGVLGIANLLKNETLTALQKEYVDTLHLSSKHLLDIVSEILDFSKMESGNFSFNKDPFNIYEVCKALFEEFEVKAIKNNLKLNFNPDSKTLINVKGDKDRLIQVLSNIISNGIKFTQQGTIDFSYYILEYSSTVDIKFTITDTGIGIPESSQQHIFDIFSQVDESTTREYGGTGLGLALTKRIVDLQHGKIALQSEVNKGTTFTVALNFEKIAPTIEIHHPEVIEHKEEKIETIDITPVEEKPLVKKLDGMRILVAEDNAVNAMVLTRFLNKWGITYDVAKNGQLALDQLETTSYDLILMDLHMPVLGGREATKIIRNSFNDYKAIPIIALTADAILDSQSDLIDEGFNQCILKPFNPDVLFNALAGYYN